MKQPAMQGKPDWLKVRLPSGETYEQVRRMLKTGALNTVCQSAACPNIGHCFSRNTATFLIMGATCTRNCRFCNISPGQPEPLDPEEPERVALAVKELGLRHAVVTSVTRDDLPDGGAAHFASTVSHIRRLNPRATIEVLIPDFQGKEEALEKVMESRPDVVNHNLETVPRLYPTVRPQADYSRSLTLLRRVADAGNRCRVRAKSGFMLGLGETDAEVLDVLSDLRDAGCRIVTIGQYLRPTRNHLPVVEYVRPGVFETLRLKALSMGFEYVASAPLVRSSYHADEALPARD